MPGNPALYPQQPIYIPRPAYESLERGQKRTAFWAGALGLVLLNFGGGTLLAVLVVGIVALAFAGVSASADPSSGLRGFDEFLAESNGALWIAVAAAVGLLIFGVGLFVSVAILRGGGIRRPWAVTWSAFGICIPVVGVLNFIGGIVAQLITTVGVFTAVASASDAGTQPDAPSGGIIVTVIIVGFVLSVFLVAVVGALAWWWMAHVFRPRVPVTTVTATDLR